MGKYKKRADGRYCTHIELPRSEDGKRRRVTVFAYSMKELDAKVADTRRELGLGVFVKNSNVTFSEYAAEWLKCKKPVISSATYSGYDLILKLHTGSLDAMPLNKIVKSDVQGCVNALAGKYDTQVKARLVINMIFNSAIDDELLAKNPCRGVELPKRIKNEKRALTDAEKAAIRSCEFTDQERLFVSLLYYTGMRRGEVLALCRSDIDLVHKEISVTKSVEFPNKSKGNIKSPKSQAGVRSIPIPDALKVELVDYMTRNNKTLYFFTNANGEIISHSTFQRLWRSCFEKINAAMGGTADVRVTDITPHIFRHNYATMLYKQGVDVKRAQVVLGHSNIKTTLEIYTHLEGLSSGSEKFDAIAL